MKSRKNAMRMARKREKERKIRQEKAKENEPEKKARTLQLTKERNKRYYEKTKEERKEIRKERNKQYYERTKQRKQTKYKMTKQKTVALNSYLERINEGASTSSTSVVPLSVACEPILELKEETHVAIPKVNPVMEACVLALASSGGPGGLVVRSWLWSWLKAICSSPISLKLSCMGPVECCIIHNAYYYAYCLFSEN